MKLNKPVILKKIAVRTKQGLSDNKGLIVNAIVHAALTWGALVFSYNTYKEIIRRGTHIFPHELKAAIKSTFPWGVLIFATLYILYSAGSRREYKRLSVKQYAVILGLYAAILSIVAVQRGAGVLIVAGISVLYLTVLLVAWGWLRSLAAMDMDRSGWFKEILPPVIYKAIKGRTPEWRRYLKKRPSVAFVGGFTVSLLICAVLVSFNQGKAAEKLAGMAYFLLMIGLAIEVYLFIRGGESYGEK